eukprot:11340-Heterococcus_DN1.PRE.2
MNVKTTCQHDERYAYVAGATAYACATATKILLVLLLVLLLHIQGQQGPIVKHHRRFKRYCLQHKKYQSNHAVSVNIAFCSADG